MGSFILKPLPTNLFVGNTITSKQSGVKPWKTKQRQKQNDQTVPQGTNEIESLNDSKELDLEQLEEVAGGGWGCNCNGGNDKE